jgi:hypothetical protein
MGDLYFRGVKFKINKLYSMVLQLFLMVQACFSTMQFLCSSFDHHSLFGKTNTLSWPSYENLVDRQFR